MFEVVTETESLPNLGSEYTALGLRSEGLVAATRKTGRAVVFLDDANNLVFVLDSGYRLSDYAQSFAGGVAHTITRTEAEDGNAVKVTKKEIDANGNILNSEEEIMEKSPILPSL